MQYEILDDDGNVVNTIIAESWFVEQAYPGKHRLKALYDESVEQISFKVRNERNLLLSSSDWVTSRSFETGLPIPTEWTTYRQALRDITLQPEFPFNIQWPVKPQ